MGGSYPTYYDEAMSSVCTHLRQEAMKRQLESLYSNIVQVPIEAPKGIKPIGVSWSTRRTQEQMESLSFLKSKIVAKGYSLKLCFNYGKPFQQWSYSNPLD